MKPSYRYRISDPLFGREVERSKRWVSLAGCRDSGVLRARELMVERGWTVAWVTVENRAGDVLRHVSVFPKGQARNRHLEHGRPIMSAR